MTNALLYSIIKRVFDTRYWKNQANSDEMSELAFFNCENPER
jgi:hypothetical protein